MTLGASQLGSLDAQLGAQGYAAAGSGISPNATVVTVRERPRTITIRERS